MHTPLAGSNALMYHTFFFLLACAISIRINTNTVISTIRIRLPLENSLRIRVARICMRTARADRASAGSDGAGAQQLSSLQRDCVFQRACFDLYARWKLVTDSETMRGSGEFEQTQRGDSREHRAADGRRSSEQRAEGAAAAAAVQQEIINKHTGRWRGRDRERERSAESANSTEERPGGGLPLL